MHELSVAQNIIELIQEHIPEPEWKRVVAVKVKIGSVAGIVPDSLKFSFQAITSDSVFCNTQLITERIPFRVQCQACNKATENEDGFAVCGACESTDIKVLSGTELQVAEIEMEEAELVV